MPRESGEIMGRIIVLSTIGNFEGEALATHPDPRFVVGLLLEGTQSTYKVKNSTIEFPVNSVVFFAIHSVALLFHESEDIVGNSYKLRIEAELVNGLKKYSLSLA